MLTEKLNTAKMAAGFSITDMATWFGCNRETMRTWLQGVTPGAHRLPQIETELKLLRVALKAGGEGQYELPLPLDVTQYTRKAYIEGMRNAVVSRVSQASAAG